MFDTESLMKMKEEISGFVNDLQQALALKTGIDRKYKHILVCGMGASAIGGGIFRDVMYYESKVSVTPIRELVLPPGEHSNTLIVTCSYSGNTMETLAVYEQAIASGLDVIAVAHGGKLEEMSLKNGNKFIKIGGELIQPRSAIGWFIGIMANIMTDASDVDLHAQLEEMMPRLKTYKDEFEADDSKAWEIAKSITGKVPVVYSTSEMASISVRFKNQLNENAKLIAFSGLLPEFNHNEVVGWCEDSFRSNFLPIIIIDENEEIITKIVMATIDLIKSKGLSPAVIITKGNTLMERMIYGLMMGDYTSLYVADIQGKDPCNVDHIVDIKSRMKKFLGN